MGEKRKNVHTKWKWLQFFQHKTESEKSEPIISPTVSLWQFTDLPDTLSLMMLFFFTVREIHRRTHNEHHRWIVGHWQRFNFFFVFFLSLVDTTHEFLISCFPRTPHRHAERWFTLTTHIVELTYSRFIFFRMKLLSHEIMMGETTYPRPRVARDA